MAKREELGERDVSLELGGSAFPVTSGYGLAPTTGMSLRDYFAGKMMASFLVNAVLPEQEDRDRLLPLVAKVSYQAADALLAARLEESVKL